MLSFKWKLFPFDEQKEDSPAVLQIVLIDEKQSVNDFVLIRSMYSEKTGKNKPIIAKREKQLWEKNYQNNYCNKSRTERIHKRKTA